MLMPILFLLALSTPAGRLSSEEEGETVAKTRSLTSSACRFRAISISGRDFATTK
jgi:hypothetical protein